MPGSVGIVEYGLGNLTSVAAAVERLDFKAVISADILQNMGFLSRSITARFPLPPWRFCAARPHSAATCSGGQ